MHFLNDTEPIFLQTDSSDYGIGGYLFQVVGWIDHPIVSNSRLLTQVPTSPVPGHIRTVQGDNTL
jgi:hypothetical protein